MSQSPKTAKEKLKFELDNSSQASFYPAQNFLTDALGLGPEGYHLTGSDAEMGMKYQQNLDNRAQSLAELDARGGLLENPADTEAKNNALEVQRWFEALKGKLK